MGLQYRTLDQIDLGTDQLEAWANSRETSIPVAVAIHAIADAKRSPEAIWEDPTPEEWDHVVMAVENYIDAGEYDREDVFFWGEESFRL